NDTIHGASPKSLFRVCVIRITGWRAEGSAHAQVNSRSNNVRRWLACVFRRQKLHGRARTGSTLTLRGGKSCSWHPAGWHRASDLPEIRTAKKSRKLSKLNLRDKSPCHLEKLL